jgi:uncharacterized membrane protein YfcA
MALHHTAISAPDEAPPPRRMLAVVAGTAVGMLGGLLGLGGAEFRLPILVAGFGYPLRRAVPLNLAISLVTVLAALATRLLAAGPAWDPMIHYAAVALAMMLAAMVGAYGAATWFAGASEAWLHRTIRALLLAIGLLLMLEAALPLSGAGVPLGPADRVGLGVVVGLPIGAVSSLLGVAGGELIIPALIFGFGAGVKVAGTLSLLISLPPVAVGLWRHRRQGARLGSDGVGLVLPMGVGSVVGAVFGALLVPHVPAAGVKLLLGLVLVASALKVFSRHAHPARRPFGTPV